MKGRLKSPVISKPTSLGSEVKSGAGSSSSSSGASRPLFETEKGREEKERRKKEKTETEDLSLPSSPKSEEHDPDADPDPDSPDDTFPRSEIKEGEVASKCVWVGNVSPEINEAQFRKHFDSFGDIDLIRMFPRSKCAFVTFKKAESAMKSLTLEGKLVGSMCLTLNIGKASRHLWVGNIGSNVTELDLRTAFEEYGTVESVRVLRGNKCAFVNFASEAEALVALENMNGKLLGFQRIVINFQWENSFKRPGRQRSQGTKGTSRYPPGISKTFEVPSRQLFVGSIVPSVTDGTLWHLFSRFGEVEQIKGYANRGYAFIVFRSLQVAIWVREQMKLYPPTIGGRALIVNFGRQPTTNPAGDDYSSYSLPSQTPMHVSAPVLSTSQPLTTSVPGTTPVSLPPQFSYPPSMPIAHASYVVALPQASTSTTSSDGLLAAPVSYTHGSSPSLSSISPTRTLESLESELRSLTLGTPYSGAIDPTSSPSLTALTQNLVPLHLLQTPQTSDMPSTSPRGAITSSPYFDTSYLNNPAGLTGFGLLGLGNQTGLRGATGISGPPDLLASLGSYTATPTDSMLQLSTLPPGISSVTSSRSVSPSHDTPTATTTTFKEFPATRTADQSTK